MTGCWWLSSIVVRHDLNILDEVATDAVGGHHMTGLEDEDWNPRRQLPPCDNKEGMDTNHW
jgi:hypothetical protein